MKMNEKNPVAYNVLMEKRPLGSKSNLHEIVAFSVCELDLFIGHPIEIILNEGTFN